MALKKSQLHNSLWQSCDELRGGMDAVEYKHVVLGLIFLKYISNAFEGNTPDLSPGRSGADPRGSGRVLA